MILYSHICGMQDIFVAFIDINYKVDISDLVIMNL